MRFFTRSIGQKIRIGDDVVLTVTSVRGGSVRLGFLVPRDMVVDREEIAEFKKQQRVAGNLQHVAQRSTPGGARKKGAAKKAVKSRKPGRKS